MPQFNKPVLTDPATRRAAMSRADLLHVWHTAGLQAAKWLANELEFEFVSLDPEESSDIPDIDVSVRLPLPTPDTENLLVKKNTPQMVSEPVWLPWKRIATTNSKERIQIEDDAPVPKLEWTKRPTALPPIGLATWPEAKTRLSPILEPSRRSPSVDIDKLVELISQGRQIRKLPTEIYYRLERNVFIVEDLSPRLIPYETDHQWLIELFKVHLPRGYFNHFACTEPRGIVDPNRSTEEAVRGRGNQELQAGCQILVLGDLGILSTSSQLQRKWQEWIQEQVRRDCRVGVMVPFPLDRIPSRYRDIAEYFSWQNSGVRSVLDHMTRDRLVQTILSRLSPVTSFDPVLLRWVRQTVPEAQDAALESFVWQDKSLASNQFSSAKNDQIESKQEFRDAFRLLDKDTKRGLLRLLRQSRAGVGQEPSLWFVELLSLDPEELELVDDHGNDFEDVQRAIRYLDEHRSEGAIGSSIRHFLSWFSTRVEKEGVWARDQRICETIRRWQREFHPKRGLDHRTRIGELGSKISQKVQRSVTLELSEKGLRVQPTSPNEVHSAGFINLTTTDRLIEVHVPINPEEAFWKSGKKPDWVSAFGSDKYGLWCEFQVPRHDGDGVVTQRLRWILPGTFMMGSDASTKKRWWHDETRHEVTLTHGFWIAETLCTQELWMAVTKGKNPSSFSGDRNPVEQVSWVDCQAWLKGLRTIHPQLQASLPTEAQWEYACRAGSTGEYCFGDSEEELENYAWFGKNSGYQLHPVGQRRPNAWGLFDVHGNVWEWCQDWYGEFTTTSVIDPSGPSMGKSRVLRGGSWYYTALYLRSACRNRNDPGFRYLHFGFRLLSSALNSEPNEGAMLREAEPGTERSRIGSGEWEYSFLQSIDLDAVGETTPEDQFSEIAVNTYTSIRVVSDQEGYQFDRLEKPDWAIDFGHDEYGLYSVIEVEPSKKGTPIRQKMRWIPPGRFLMGSPEGKDYGRGDEYPRHEVVITHGYWMFDTPCTQALWTALMGENPSYFEDPARPVEQVSWEDAVGFAVKLNQWFAERNSKMRGKKVLGWDELVFRLPTESEWEYACRAGTRGDKHAGELALEAWGQTKAEALDSIAWYGGNCGREYDLRTSMELSWTTGIDDKEKNGGTRKVATKTPNPWGLYDMLGNVWEWCEDWYGEYAADRAIDPTGPDEGTSRVLRGGSWVSTARNLRSACRSRFLPGRRVDSLGFRLLSSAHQAKPTESGEGASRSEQPEEAEGRGR